MFSQRNAFALPLADEGPFELRKRSHDGQHQIGHRGIVAGEREAFFDEFNAHAFVRECLDNSTQIVDDIDAARHFYAKILGFTIEVEVNDQPMMPEPRQNVLGVPDELAATQHWNIAMLKPPGEHGGSVEIISLPGISGRDFAPLADPPNRGIVSLRFPVDDVDALVAAVGRISTIDRVMCRQRVEESYSTAAFASRVESWFDHVLVGDPVADR